MKEQAPKLILGMGIGVFALIWFFWEMDINAIQTELLNIKLWWVFLSILILVGEFGIRALRWQVLLKPMGYRISLKLLFSAQVIGAALNTILPLRVGELAKPYVVSKKTGHPFIAITATAVMERVFDILGMVTVLALMVFLLGDSPKTNTENAILVNNLQLYGGIFGVFALLCMVLFFILTSRQEKARPVFEKIISICPEKLRVFFLRLFDGFVLGLISIQSKRAIVQAAGLSILMWLNGALAIFCLFKAFTLPLPFGAACFTSVAIALTVALPQAPGFVGVFHIAIEKTLLLWGMALGPAKGFAIVFWAVSFVPVTVIGMIRLWREGLNWNILKTIAKDEHPNEKP